MADTSNVIGLGCSISATTSTASTSFAALGGLLSISGPDGTADVADVTTMDSTTFKRFKRSVVDSGDVTISLAYRSTDAGQVKAATLYKNRAKAKFKVSFPSGGPTDETFTGHVSGMGREIPKGELITRSITVKVTGNPGYCT